MNSNNEDFLRSIFQHVLDISKGECHITDEVILAAKNENERNILHGLLYLYEDLELSKEDFKRAISAEYKLKILEQKNKELEQFVYVASHDLQEPLYTINSFSQLLKRDYKGKLDDKANHYLKFLSQAAGRMSQLIKGLLDLSRIGTNKTRVNIDCNNLVNDAIADLSASIKKANAKIHVDTLPTIKGYETELRLLFQNLISNAIKFRRPDVSPEVYIKAIRENDYWRFIIEDNGTGIEKKYNERIFIIFQRLNNKREYEGTGIGLAHCQKIVELHGGKIGVDSVPGKGSTFYFTIPVD